jgi:hypothetical protein
MRQPCSSYYPARASKWGLAFRSYRLRRWLHLDRLAELNSRRWLFGTLSLFIPSLGFWSRWHWRIAGRVSAGTIGLLGLFLIFLGTSVATIAFGLILAIHVTGVLIFFRDYLAQAQLGSRLVLIVILTLVLSLFLYRPAWTLLQTRLLMPLNVNGRTMVVNCMDNFRGMKRGDWVAFTVQDQRAGQLVMRAGYGASPVYGLPGDRVRFTRVACVVNGVPRERRPYMPDTGEIVVPREMWFVWPEYIVHYPGRANETAVTAMIMDEALVSRSDLVGRPFKRWFWRKQISE